MSTTNSSRSRSPLFLVRRVTTFSVATMAVAAFAVSHQQPAAQPLARLPSSSQDRAYAWTATLAARFPGCEERLRTGLVPSAFVVQRLDGSLQRMAFDEAWRRTHDATHADDVWVHGACR